MVMPYHLHMPSYFLETFTEYPLAIASYFAFCILIFDVFVSHLFDVIRYFPYIEEENDLQYSEYDRYYKAYLCVCLSVSL